MKFVFLSSFAHLALDPQSDRVSGGAELQVALLARALVQRGHEVVVIGGDIGQKDHVVFDGVRTRTGGKFHTGKLWDTLKAIPRVLSLLHQEKPDYVGILGWTTWLSLIDYGKHIFGYKSIFICGLDTEVNGEFRRANPLRGVVFEKAMDRCDIRFAMSTYQKKCFKQRGTPCGFYRNLILPRAQKRTAEKDIDFLWVARCQPIKQPHQFLDLAERIPEAKFEMVCPREDVRLWESVKLRASRLPQVTFHERIPYHQIQSVYDRAQVFVNTSLWEGFPNSLIQAGQGEAALLSLRINPDGLFDSFRPGYCAQNNFENFVDRANELRRHPLQLKKMQEESLRFVNTWHDNETNVDAFLEGLIS